jgi:chromosome segregation ATPase
VAVPRPAPASEVQKLNKEIETLLARIAVLTQTNGKNDRELAQAKAKIVELEAGLAQAQKNSDEQDEEIGKKDGDLVIASFKSDEAKAKIAELEKGLAQRDTRITELETGLPAENSDLRAQLGTANARVAELETGLAQRDTRITELETGLAAANAGGAAGAAPIAAVVIDVETQDLIDQNTSLQKINSDLRAELGAQRSRVNALNLQFQGAKRKLEELEKPADDDGGVKYVGTTFVQNTVITEDLANNGGEGGAGGTGAP